MQPQDFIVRNPDNVRVGFKGGAARNAMLEMCGMDPEPLRDLDMVLLFENEDQETPALELFWAGQKVDVEAVGSVEEYLSSRDFNINEVAVLDSGEIVYSPECLKGFQNREIKISRFERENGCGGGSWEDRLLSRAALFAARLGFSIAEGEFSRGGLYDLFIVLVGYLKACKSGVEDEYWETICQYRPWLTGKSLYSLFAETRLEMPWGIIPRPEEAEEEEGFFCVYEEAFDHNDNLNRCGPIF